MARWDNASSRIKVTLINAAAVFALFAVLVVVKENNLLNNYIQGLIIQCCYAIVMTASLNIATGFLGQLALGHAGFMAVGAYTSALVTKALSGAGVLSGNDSLSKLLLLMIGVLSGALLAAAFGVAVGVPALRLRGDYLAIITLGFGEIIRVVIQNLPIAGGKGLGQGQAGQALIGIKNLGNLYISYFLMVGTVAILYSFVRSKYGRAIMAIREDEIASEASGINTTYYKVLAFSVAAFFAGVAGAIFAHRGLGTLRHSDFTFLKSTEYLIMVVLGGMGSLTGSIVAAIVLSVVPEMLRAFAEYRMLVYSVVLVLMMIFRPIGLCGSYEFSLTLFLKTLPDNLRALPKTARAAAGRLKDLPARAAARLKNRGAGAPDDSEEVVP